MKSWLLASLFWLAVSSFPSLDNNRFCVFLNYTASTLAARELERFQWIHVPKVSFIVQTHVETSDCPLYLQAGANVFELKSISAGLQWPVVATSARHQVQLQTYEFWLQERRSCCCCTAMLATFLKVQDRSSQADMLSLSFRVAIDAFASFHVTAHRGSLVKPFETAHPFETHCNTKQWLGPRIAHLPLRAA